MTIQITEPNQNIGPFVTGERPMPLLYQYQDSNGAALTLTGYTVKFIVRERDGAPTTFNATLIDGPTGMVGYTWTGTEFPTPGNYLAEFWAGNTVQRFASWLVLFSVRAAVGLVPAI
jgi:hypothetical protein